jgi:C-terminal peptidase prc
MWKKIVAIFISLTITTLASSTGVFAFYQDIEQDNPHYQAITILYSLGKLPESTHFNPEKPLNKADLYKILIEYSGAPLAEKVEHQFIDLESSSDYDLYLQTAINHELITPYSNWFGAKKTISLQEALSETFKALGIGTTTLYNLELFPFEDIEPNSEIASIAYKAYQLGLITGPNFSGTNTITKGEFAELLYFIDEQENYSIYGQQGYEFPAISITSELEANPKYYILENVYDSLQHEYFYQEELNDDDLIYNAIQGLLEGVDDPYTSFQEPLDANQYFESLEGELQGIGIVIEILDNKVTIVTPLKDSPAEQAGLKANDIITTVDNEEIDPENINDVVSRIRGKAGTKVTIGINRDGQNKSFEIERGFIIVETVSYEILKSGNKNIAHIQITNFGEKTYTELVSTLNELDEKGINGYILDLRNNPGGYIDIAVSIVSLLSNEVETAVEISYNSGVKESYFTDGNGQLSGEKVVTLVNQGSASASEILAGFIQDNEIGLIIGQNTFGKGSVQRLTEFSDNSLFKYTIAKWVTPAGQDISEHGITPDKLVNQIDNSGKDEQLEAALEEF